TVPAADDRDSQLTGGRGALADHVDIAFEHGAQLGGLAVVVLGVRPAVPSVEHLTRHARDAVGYMQPEHRIDMRRDATKVAFQHRANDRPRARDRPPLAGTNWAADPARVQ